MFDLSGKVAVVAGGAGYLGTPTCVALARQGAAVAVADVSPAKAGAGVAAVKAAVPGARVEPAVFDGADPASIEALMQGVKAQLGPPDILVVMTYRSIGKRVADLTPEEFDLCNRTNVTGTFLLARAGANAMPDGGRIVLFSSMYGFISPDPRVYAPPVNPNPVEYGAGKAAVEQMVRYLAVHYAPRGIRVNGIAPGPFPWPSQQQADPAYMGRLAGKVPLGRIGRQDECAGGVVYLVSDEAAYVTGHILRIDGGWTSW